MKANSCRTLDSGRDEEVTSDNQCYKVRIPKLSGPSRTQNQHMKRFA